LLDFFAGAGQTVVERTMSARKSSEAPYISASHRDLYPLADELPRCDVCDEPLPPVADDDADPFAVRGEGMLIWYRGDERRVEARPLCERCGTAVGLKALQRWEIEEEEG
jgi:hypothetical protein